MMMMMMTMKNKFRHCNLLYLSLGDVGQTWGPGWLADGLVRAPTAMGFEGFVVSCDCCICEFTATFRTFR